MFRVERPVVLQPGLRPGPVETMTRYRVGPVLLVGPPGPGYALIPDPDHPGLYILSDDGGPLPAGGLTGQVLVKASDADTDYAWADIDAGGGDVPVIDLPGIDTTNLGAGHVLRAADVPGMLEFSPASAIYEGDPRLGGGGGGGASGLHQMLPGYYYACTHGHDSTWDGFPLTAGTLYVSPLLVGETTPIDRLSCKIVGGTAAGDQVRMGLYRASRLQPTGVPVCQGVVDASASGTLQATVNVTLDPGMYFLALVTSGASTQSRAFTSGGKRWSNNGHEAGDYYSTLPGGVFRYSGASAATPLPDGSTLTGRAESHGMANDIVYMSVRAA